MLLNLVSNAIKYNRPNGRVEVTIKSAVPGYWRLMVTDTGVGIAEEEQKLLFQPFTRVGHKQAQIEGTGIGLAFTRKLARLMHGQIGFRSEPGIGSCFWVDLPAVVSRDTQQATGTGPLVLYIEDDALSQKLLATVLARRRPDLQLELAALGGDGLEIARQKKPALILLDQNLPDMSGAEIYRGLKSDFATENIPVFALSGNAAETDRQAALASGYRHYLTKPIQVEELLAAVSELLPQHDGPVPS
jgi:CheY-like chemotaxis protein